MGDSPDTAIDTPFSRSSLLFMPGRYLLVMLG